MRYLPLTNEDRAEMRDVIGISNINQLFANVPETVSLDPNFNKYSALIPLLSSGINAEYCLKAVSWTKKQRAIFGALKRIKTIRPVRKIPILKLTGTPGLAEAILA